MAKKQTEAEKLAEQERLIEVLKFTPCTYTIQTWGYGGEVVMGRVDRKIYDYFRHRRLDVSEFSWTEEYAEENKIPEDMHPFWPGNYYDCDNLAHSYGVSLDAGTLQICDEKGDTVLERALTDIDGTDINLCCGDEAWIGMVDPGEVVFIGRTHDKGTFFEGEFELREPFDPEKLCLNYDEVDGEEILTSITYNDEDIDNNGGSTSGKGSDYGFYLYLGDGKWEKYTNMDDIEYEMTDWFPAKTNPVREGKYQVEVKDYTYHALWNGEFWHNDWNQDKLKIKRWRGLAQDPDYRQLPDE